MLHNLCHYRLHSEAPLQKTNNENNSDKNWEIGNLILKIDFKGVEK